MELFTVDWRELFIPQVSLLELFIRGTFMYFALFLLFRYVVRRDPGDLSIADMLLVVIVADAAQNAMAGGYQSITEGVILVGTLVFWNYALDWLAYRLPIMQRFAAPAPLMLVNNGRLVMENLQKEMITEDDVMSKLREQGVEKLSEVKQARLESDGQVSVIRKKRVSK